jgi:hypothetical protein
MTMKKKTKNTQPNFETPAASDGDTPTTTNNANATTTTTTTTTSTTSFETFMGYMRCRHHHVGALWRERFCVLEEGAHLKMYATEEAYHSSSGNENAMEGHDIFGVTEWSLTNNTTSHDKNSIKKQKRYGFRLEMEADSFMECSVVTLDQKTKWIQQIQLAIASMDTYRVIARDAALPFVQDACMEGYLKLKERTGKASVHGKTALFIKSAKPRYVLLLGTQLVIYETQKEAIEKIGKIPPSAVHEVTKVIPWTSGSSAMTTTSTTTTNITPTTSTTTSSSMNSSTLSVEDDTIIETQGFLIETRNNQVCIHCKANSSLEKKRWMNAIEDELNKAQKRQEELEKAFTQQQEKGTLQNEVKNKLKQAQSDAMRQSAMLKQILANATSSIQDDEGDEDFDNEEDEDEDACQVDYIDMNPDSSSPMGRKAPNHTFLENTSDELKKKLRTSTTTTTTTSSSSSSSTWQNLLNFCTCQCLERRHEQQNKASIQPFNWFEHPEYRCEYFKVDNHNKFAYKDKDTGL